MRKNDRKSSAVVSTHAKQQDLDAVGENGNRVVARKQEFYEGSLPHPEHFAQFEKILPGSADRILSLTEREQKAAHEAAAEDLAFRNKVLESTVDQNNKKHSTALLALAMCLVTSLGLAYLGADVAAGIVGGTTVVGVVASFLRNKVLESKSKQSSRNQSDEKTTNIAKR